MGTVEQRPYLLVNQIQGYEWGTRGRAAFIPRLLGAEGEEDRPYAELWIGAHPTAPSEILANGGRVPLGEFIRAHPTELLGPAVVERFGLELPFLLKVLSAGQALSIQAHPNREQARRLHSRDPEHYPDANHKPEIAVALDSLTALAGFKSWSEIVRELELHPELSDWVGRELVASLIARVDPTATEQRELVHRLYSAIMYKSIEDPAGLANCVERLAEKLRQRANCSEAEALFVELEQSYPGDIGLLSILMLNLVHLEQDQALYTGPGVPHAYISGNVVECMANSDNVVRAGLTSKFKDVGTLLEILSYEPAPAPVLSGRRSGGRIEYDAPAAEFQLSQYRLSNGQGIVGTTRERPVLLLVVSGAVRVEWGLGPESNRLELNKGATALLPALLGEYTLHATADCGLFAATVP